MSDVSVVDLLFDAARKHPHRTALATNVDVLTFGELAAGIEQCGAEFARMGVQSGSRVALLLPNSSEFVVSTFAVLHLGGVVVPLDPRWREAELMPPLRESSPSVIVAFERFWHHDVRGVVTALSPRLRASPNVCFIVEDRSKRARRREWTLPASPSRPMTRPEVAALKLHDSIAITLYTSGASHTPKSVNHSHAGLVAFVRTLEATHHNYFAGPGRVRRMATTVAKYKGRLLRPAMGRQVWFTPLAFHGIAGLNLLLQSLCTGQTLVTLDVFDPRRALDLMERQHVTTAAMSPSMAEHVLRAQRRKPRNTRSLLVLGLGSSAVRPALVGELQDAFGCAVPIGYGSTELGGGVLATNLTDSQKVQSTTVGRPFPGAEVKVVDENGHLLPPEQVGELWCRAPTLMVGYGGGAPDEGIDGEGWYHTKDLGAIDDDGNVSILGRMSDLIIHGGKNVYAFEVEGALCEHEDVVRAAVIGIAHGSDERVCAFVETQSAKPDLVAIRKKVASQLAPYKVPHQIQVVSDWPLSADGKILKAELCTRAQQDVPARNGPCSLGAVTKDDYR